MPYNARQDGSFVRPPYLQEAFHELEEKLSHANLQRQQLIRKVQFLEEANADMLNMAEANRKLKTEMGRVAEL